MATIPIHQPADCGVTKPLRREPHAACRPIDTTLYHASIDDGSLSLFLFFISLFFSSRSSMTGFAWFFLTRTSQSTTSHTHTHSHTQKKGLIDTGFHGWKDIFFFSSSFPKGLNIKSHSTCIELYLFRSFHSIRLCTCVSVCCVWMARGWRILHGRTFLFYFSILRCTPLFDGLSKSYRHLFSFFFFFYPFLLLLCCFLYTRTPSILPFGTNMHNWRIGLSSLFSHCHGRCWLDENRNRRRK